MNIGPIEPEDRTSLMRLIADHGLSWQVGCNHPLISWEDGIRGIASRDVSAVEVGVLVAEGLLEAGLLCADTGHPRIEYKLTANGAQFVLDSFRHFPKVHATLAEVDIEHKTSAKYA